VDIFRYPYQYYFFPDVTDTFSVAVLALSVASALAGVVTTGFVAGLEAGSSLVSDLLGIYNGPRAPQPPSAMDRLEHKIKEEIRVRILYLCNTV